ncbi:MAG: DUF6222 family protein [Pseudonocardiales bacterium]|nr:DUF6222 family protein [Pseudonocardiales bacterium]
MTEQQPRGTGRPPRTSPPRAAAGSVPDAAAGYLRSRTSRPTLARGLVWSDLVREMEEEWAAKQAAAAGTVVALPRAAAPRDGDAPRAVGEAA